MILSSDPTGPPLLLGASVCVDRCLPGQTVCLGDPRPCYKIAYFHDVWSRVAFKEASEACQMDGGSLLSIQTAGEQTDIEHLLQVRLSPPPPPPSSSTCDLPCLQELRSGAVGGAGAAGGIADGDFWIGLVRLDDHTPTEPGSTSTSCSELYRWTDGSPASFR